MYTYIYTYNGPRCNATFCSRLGGGVAAARVFRAACVFYIVKLHAFSQRGVDGGAAACEGSMLVHTYALCMGSSGVIRAASAAR